MNTHIYNISNGCGSTRTTLEFIDSNSFKFNYYSHWMSSSKLDKMYKGTYAQINEKQLILTCNDEPNLTFTFTKFDNIIPFVYGDKEHEGIVIGRCEVNSGYSYYSSLLRLNNYDKNCEKIFHQKEFRMLSNYDINIIKNNKKLDQTDDSDYLIKI